MRTIREFVGASSSFSRAPANRSGRIVGLLLVLLLISPLNLSAYASDVPPHTPATSLQVWQINILNLTKNWDGFVQRMQIHPFAPDIIIVNELKLSNVGGGSANDIDEFMAAITGIFGPHYNFAHSDSTGLTVGGNVVIWNNDRLSRIGSPARWANPCGNSKTQIGVHLRDKSVVKNVLVASLHAHFEAGGTCVRTVLSTADTQLETLRNNAPIGPGPREMTIIGGDLNQRPDKIGLDGPNGEELPESGLEADPDCWYRAHSAAHLDLSVVEGNCAPATKRYYDTAWLYPGTGGGTNPTATSFCEQYTAFTDYQLGIPTTSDGTNSCTDLVGNPNQTVPGPDGKLDKQRIDYIWVGWENSAGNAWTPPAEVAAAFVDDAGADLGLDLADVSSYSDHRSVRALLTWPPATP